jgi:hypothetical protein
MAILLRLINELWLIPRLKEPPYRFALRTLESLELRAQRPRAEQQ